MANSKAAGNGGCDKKMAGSKTPTVAKNYSSFKETFSLCL